MSGERKFALVSKPSGEFSARGTASAGGPGSFDAGGGGSDDGGMEVKIAQLETKVERIQEDIAELRSDVRALRGDIASIRTTDFRLLFGAIIAVALGLAGLMAKGFHWL